VEDILKALYIVSFTIFTSGLILTYFMPAVALGLFVSQKKFSENFEKKNFFEKFFRNFFFWKI